jgi:hypothetical protein
MCALDEIYEIAPDAGLMVVPPTGLTALNHHGE